MKKFFLIILIVFSASFFFGHSPSGLTIKYDAETKMVLINVIHNLTISKVVDPAKHYIKEIIVSVNNKVVITEAIAFQQSDAGEISSFLLKVKPGDKVNVKAVCSISGSKTEEIIIQ